MNANKRGKEATSLRPKKLKYMNKISKKLKL